jgi:ubiquitin C
MTQPVPKSMARKRSWSPDSDEPSTPVRPITTRLLVGNKTKLLILDVEEGATFADVKDMIETKAGIPSNEQCLTLRGRILEDDKGIADYEIDRWTVVKLNICFDITVHRFGVSEGFFLTVNGNDTIDSVKAQIQEREGIPSENQRLMFDGDVLGYGDFTVSEYSIQKDSVIDLQVVGSGEGQFPQPVTPTFDMVAPLPAISGPEFEIMAASVSGKTISLDVKSSSASVREVKCLIREKEWMPTDDLQLVFDGQTLDDDRTISDYNIQKGDTVQFVVVEGVLSRHCRRMGDRS